MSNCPLIVFSMLFGGVMIVAFAVCFLNATQLSFWSNYVMFVIIHLNTLDTILEIVLYSACAVVQMIKI